MRTAIDSNEKVRFTLEGVGKPKPSKIITDTDYGHAIALIQFEMPLNFIEWKKQRNR